MSSFDALGSKNKTDPMPKKKESQILLSQNQALFKTSKTGYNDQPLGLTA